MGKVIVRDGGRGLPARHPGVRARRLLKVSALLLVLIGIHAVLFQVLVGAAGERVEALEREHGAERLEGARAPGPAPAVESADFATWRAEEALWSAARERGEARTRRQLLGTAILVSCGVQVLLLLAIGVRVLRSR